jgi:hypothetical protein
MLTTVTKAASVVLDRLHRDGGREANKREDGEGQHVGELDAVATVGYMSKQAATDLRPNCGWLYDLEEAGWLAG